MNTSFSLLFYFERPKEYMRITIDADEQKFQHNANGILRDGTSMPAGLPVRKKMPVHHGFSNQSNLF